MARLKDFPEGAVVRAGRCQCGGQLVPRPDQDVWDCGGCGSALSGLLLAKLDRVLTEIMAGYVEDALGPGECSVGCAVGHVHAPPGMADRPVEVAPDFPSRCMACDREFRYPGVVPVQVGGCFYHPGCQPVAWALPLPPAPNMRGVVTGIDTIAARPSDPDVPHGSICPLHPEVVLEGGEACFKCCAWGVPG